MGDEQSPTGRSQAPIAIVAYDPAWPARFEAERARLRRLAPAAVRIEHVGSTSVPGLAAKPIIDILVGARSLPDFEACIPVLESAGFEYVPELEEVLPERRFLVRPKLPASEVHVHAVEIGTPFWRNHLRFRDRLRADPALAASYEALKRRLAAEHRRDRDAYTEAKGPFVRNVLEGTG